jgi:hypothetical protein
MLDADVQHPRGEREGEWSARKHGGAKRRVWRKLHIGIDEQTLEIRAAEFTTSDIGDAPILPELLDQIPPEQEIATVTADGAFDTRKCHEAIAARGAAAIIPPRKNAKPWKPDTAGAIARNEILRTSKRLGRTIWRRWSGYHRRSRAETKMHCVKLLGQRLSAREFDRQVAEFHVRVAVLNGFTALGIPVTEAVGSYYTTLPVFRLLEARTRHGSAACSGSILRRRRMWNRPIRKRDCAG